MRKSLENRDDVEVFTTGWSTGNYLSTTLFPSLSIPNEPCNDWKPDIIIIMDDSKDLYKQKLPYNSEIPTVVYGVDAAVIDYKYNAADRHIDHFFLSCYTNCVQDIEADDCSFLPCGYCHHTFIESDISYKERKFDCSLIGALYLRRASILNRLYRSKLKTYYLNGLSQSQTNLIYNNSRVSVNMSGANEVSQRIFETLASGCYVLSDELTDLERLGVPEDYIHQSTINDFVDQAKKLAGRDDTPQYPAEWLEKQTWSARFDTILEWLNK